jgi:hypothetical protein
MLIGSELGIEIVGHEATPGSSRYYTRKGPSVNSELGLLEFRIASASAMPNFYDPDAPVPVIVEDADRAVFTGKVDRAVCTSHKLAVIREVADI